MVEGVSPEQHLGHPEILAGFGQPLLDKVPLYLLRGSHEALRRTYAPGTRGHRSHLSFPETPPPP